MSNQFTISKKGRHEFARVCGNTAFVYLERGMSNVIIPNGRNPDGYFQLRQKRMTRILYDNFVEDFISPLDLNQSLEVLEDIQPIFTPIHSVKRKRQYPQIQDLKEVLKEEKMIEAVEMLKQNFKQSYIKSKLNLKQKDIKHAQKCIIEQRNVIYYDKGKQQQFDHKFIEQMKEILQSDEQQQYSVQQIRKQLLDINNVSEYEISYSKVYTELTQKLGFSYKEPTPIYQNLNSPAVKDQRCYYCRQILAWIEVGILLNWEDETGINLKMLKKKRWMLMGFKKHIKQNPKSTNYSVFCMMNREKVVGYSVLKGGGLWEYQVYFMNECHLIQLRDHLPEELAYILDRAAIHTAKGTKELFLDFNKHMFSAASSPLITPIEYSFQKAKSYVSGRVVENEAQLIKVIYEAFSSITQVDCFNYVTHVISYYKDCLLKNNIY